MMGLAVVIEKGESNYSAYSPDLPGCVAAGRTVRLVKQNMRRAIKFHLDGLRRVKQEEA